MNEQELIQQCKNHFLRCVPNADGFLVHSRTDTWLIVPHFNDKKELDFYELRHKNKKTNKHCFHFQGRFFAINSVVKYMYGHQFKYMSRKKERINYLFGMIERNETPKHIFN